MVAWQPKSLDFEKKYSITVQIRIARFGETLSSVEFFLMEPNPGANKGKNKGTHIFTA